MKIKLINIGNELLDGNISDKNGPWLAHFLFSKGLELTSIECIRDSQQEIHKRLEYDSINYDLLIFSGGLGPTKDDITKVTLASYYQVPLIEDEKARNLAISHYKRINKEWTRDLNDYHLIPESFEALENSNGLAPGLFFQDKKGTLIALTPGVPREFSAMLEYSIFPKCIKKQENISLFHHDINIRTHGIPEEKIFTEIDSTLWEKLEKFGQVSSLPQTNGVDVHVKFKTDNEAAKNIKKAILLLLEDHPLSPYIWQIGNLPLENFLVEKAREKGVTISFAESCTGGLVSSRITDISGCSDVFMGGIVSYSNEMKIEILNVDPEIINSFGAVSEECVGAMTKGSLEKTSSDYALSFSGIAGPLGGSERKPVGTVTIGYGNKEKIQTTTFKLNGDRLLLKERFLQKGLQLLLEEINNH